MTGLHSRKEKRTRRWIGYLLLDVFLTGLILCTFALFHHVLPIARAKKAAAERAGISIEAPVGERENTAVSSSEEAPEPEPELLTAWQRKFAEHFTDETVITENSYTSPNVSLTITTHEENLGKGNVRWYVCDIYVASLDNMQTALAHDGYNYYDDQDILEMMEAHNALFAMGGDSCLRQAHCFAVKNGVVYDDRATAAEFCVLYADGSMEILRSGETETDALLSAQGDKAVLQSWHFGPALITGSGEARTDFSGVFDRYIFMGTLQPRAGIGYYEPGHYCMIVAEGRGASVGVRMDQFAELFAGEGCTLAYNLDGGRTAQIAFNGEKYSLQSNGNRNPQNDIIYLTDTAPSGGEERP